MTRLEVEHALCSRPWLAGTEVVEPGEDFPEDARVRCRVPPTPSGRRPEIDFTFVRTASGELVAVVAQAQAERDD